jgi:hypothetical protein
LGRGNANTRRIDLWDHTRLGLRMLRTSGRDHCRTTADDVWPDEPTGPMDRCAVPRGPIRRGHRITMEGRIVGIGDGDTATRPDVGNPLDRHLGRGTWPRPCQGDVETRPQRIGGSTTGVQRSKASALVVPRVVL